MSSTLPKRLFDLVEALQGSGRRTTTDLAEQLGVSERTVRRDLARLQDLDVLVDVRPGRGGGVRLEAGALLPALRFTDDELLALVVGLKQAADGSDAGLERSASRALARLETVLSSSTRERLQALQEALAPNVPVATAVPAPSEHIFALAEAARRQVRVEIGYRSDDTITRRHVDPYGLVRLGPWYMVGHCHLRNDLRTFRLDRVRSVRPTDETFVRPEGFDTFRHVTRSIALAPGHGDVLCHAVLDTDLETASRFVPLTTVALEPGAEGVRLTVRTRASDLDWIAFHLQRLPWRVRVEGPPALLEACEAMSRRLEGLAAGTVFG